VAEGAQGRQSRGGSHGDHSLREVCVVRVPALLLLRSALSETKGKRERERERDEGRTISFMCFFLPFKISFIYKIMCFFLSSQKRHRNHSQEIIHKQEIIHRIMCFFVITKKRHRNHSQEIM
jgi:hypothetical protein